MRMRRYVDKSSRLFPNANLSQESEDEEPAPRKKGAKAPNGKMPQKNGMKGKKGMPEPESEEEVCIPFLERSRLG